MHILHFASVTVELDGEGYLRKPLCWTPAIGEELARAAGIDLTPHHWKVLHTVRDGFRGGEETPSLDGIQSRTGITPAGLRELFPGNVEESIARIAGLPRRKLAA